MLYPDVDNTEEYMISGTLKRRIRGPLALGLAALLSWVFLGCLQVEGPETPYYLVVFAADGGAPAPKEQRIPEGGAAAAPAAMGKTGYTFAYWYAEDSGSPWNFDTGIISGNTTLLAQWEPISYTVVYNKNANDAAGIMADSSHAYDAAEKLSVNGFSRPGHAFIGWAASPTEPAAYWDGQSVSNLSAEQDAAVTLYAKWVTGSGYTVTFNPNGGAGAGTIGYALDTPAITLPTPVRAGYSFGGWYTDSALSGMRLGKFPRAAPETENSGQSGRRSAMPSPSI
jgi:uncharacterized repeat protein (TIGR02543 family)